jgi:uncharacterized protein
MQNAPSISRITIYPVKSLDGIDLQKAMITDGGCILHDREFAMIDPDGNYVNGKSNPLVHSLRSSVDFITETITFRKNPESNRKEFHLIKEKSEIELYLSEYFGFQVDFKRNTNGRFLDVPDIAGVTILSTSTLRTISGWYGNLSTEETRKRFRATLEIEGVDAFWEDCLFSKVGRGVEFKIGEVTVIGMRPCARCVVPSRNTITGEVTKAFTKTFSKHRSDSLPAWSTLNDFGHYYFLSVNCLVPPTEIGKWIEVGDQVKIIGEKFFD